MSSTRELVPRVGQLAWTYSFVLILGMLFFFVSFWVSTTYGETPAGDLAENITRELGTALVIAYVVIIIVEQRSWSEQTDLVKAACNATMASTFERIFGVQFPAHMFEFVRDRLMRQPIFREDTFLSYNLRRANIPVDKFGMDVLVMVTQLSYWVTNVSGEVVDYPVRVFVERTLLSQVDAEVAKREGLGLLEFSIDNDELDTAQDGTTEKWHNTPEFIRFEHLLRIPPNGRHFVKIKYGMLKLAMDTEAWRSLYPCSGLEVQVHFPEGYALSIDAMHVDDFRRVSDGIGSMTRRLDSPLFPSNGCLLWWHPRAPQSPTA